MAILAVLAVAAIACNYLYFENSLKLDSLGDLFKLAVVLYFMYFVRDIAASLREIAKNKK